MRLVNGRTNRQTAVVSMTEKTEPPRLGHVVGENFKRLREAQKLTQAEASQVLRARGLPWARTQVAGLESRQRESVESATLLLLAEALQAKVVDLFDGDGAVRLTAQVVASRRYIRDVLSGLDSAETLTVEGAAARALIQSMPGDRLSFQADAELAQRLGLRPEDVYDAAEQLWGRTLHQERDRRVAELGEMAATARRVRRGHITRQLAKELHPHLPNGKEGDGSTEDQTD